jgi:hypothetical protein
MFFQPTSDNYVYLDVNQIVHFVIINIHMLWLVVVL